MEELMQVVVFWGVVIPCGIVFEKLRKCRELKRELKLQYNIDVE